MKKSIKKEFANALNKGVYKRVKKRDVAYVFHADWNLVYDEMIKDQYKRVKIEGTKETKQKGIKDTEAKKKWFWPRFYNLIAAKYRIDLLPANDELYFLARRITEPEIEKNKSKWAERLELVKQFLKPQKCTVSSY